MPEYDPSTVRAKSSIKSLNFELTNLTPSSMVTFFEIDISAILKDKGIVPDLTVEAQAIGFKRDVNDGILRFHNNIKIFNSYVVWQGKTYYPAPIQAEGFESTSKGTLPRPTLTIASQSETGSDQLALLKHEIRKLGDIINAKVTRRRTFAKYLDVINFTGASSGATASSETLPDGYEPDPYAELPKDIYFIERKTTENKNVLTYELASILDLEGIKIPKRVIISDKCVWQYRGIGCWYQHAQQASRDGKSVAENPVPLLEKAQLNYLDGGENDSRYKGLPKVSPPVGTENDEKMNSFVKVGSDKGEWSPDEEYTTGQYIYLLKDKIKYYFVAKIPEGDTVVPKGTMPPNDTYWIADECSKSLTGCRMRWGLNGAFKNTNALKDCKIKAGDLPFGGFPAARKIARGG